MPKPPLFTATGAFESTVRARRVALELSQEALAGRTDLQWSYLGQIERGRRNLTLHNILKIAAALEIDPAELVAGILAE